MARLVHWITIVLNHFSVARCNRADKTARDAKMNHKSNLYLGVALSLLAAILIATAALGDDLSASEVTVAYANIIVAEVAPASAVSMTNTSANQDAAVTEALEGVRADSKLELEVRLSGHKSEILTAGL